MINITAAKPRVGRSHPLSRALALAALLLLAGLSAACAADKEEQQAAAAMEELKSDFASIGEQTKDDPFARLEAFDVGPEAEDEAGRVHQVGRQFMNSMMVPRNAYLAELDAMGWGDILDADRLKADTGLVETRGLLARAQEAKRRTETDLVAAYNTFPDLVQASSLSDRAKREMIAGFQKSSPKALAQMREGFGLETQTLAQFEAMVDLLERVEWDAVDSQIVFQADADVETFNRHFDRINELTAEFAARQQAVLQRAQE